ncbi:hypothetical protein EVAR_2219_1 [Eumeta japonica]|uniref:Uncharacterized protein n=1 Tax=Eumeta variegata TaxID=151549 RepID=A0A4C1SID1_EUMVA|nr:hypothetical protein EVAR_2219_1 [Eumeta japonica]
MVNFTALQKWTGCRPVSESSGGSLPPSVTPLPPPSPHSPSNSPRRPTPPAFRVNISQHQICYSYRKTGSVLVTSLRLRMDRMLVCPSTMLLENKVFNY